MSLGLIFVLKLFITVTVSHYVHTISDEDEAELSTSTRGFDMKMYGEVMQTAAVTNRQTWKLGANTAFKFLHPRLCSSIQDSVDAMTRIQRYCATFLYFPILSQ